MKLYAETSAILRWLFDEEFGEDIRRHLRSAEKVTASRLTLLESRRTIRRAVSGKRLREAEAAGVRATLARAAARWAILEISRDVVSRAEQGFPREPLRTLDAIHLASALALRESLPDLLVLTTDERVRHNALELGFTVLPD